MLYTKVKIQKCRWHEKKFKIEISWQTFTDHYIMWLFLVNQICNPVLVIYIDIGVTFCYTHFQSNCRFNYHKIVYFLKSTEGKCQSLLSSMTSICKLQCQRLKVFLCVTFVIQCVIPDLKWWIPISHLNILHPLPWCWELPITALRRRRNDVLSYPRIKYDI